MAFLPCLLVSVIKFLRERSNQNAKEGHTRRGKQEMILNQGFKLALFLTQYDLLEIVKDTTPLINLLGNAILQLSGHLRMI